jgi:hypothetical protein
MRMSVKLSLKSIGTKSDTHLVVSYEIKSELQDLMLEVVTPVLVDLNAVEQQARSRLEQFATGLREACQQSPLHATVAAAQKRLHP